MAKHLSRSVEHGQVDDSKASASLLEVKDEVQASVRDWARGVSNKSTRMVEDLLEHQQEHLSMVGDCCLTRLTARLAPFLTRQLIWLTWSSRLPENTSPQKPGLLRERDSSLMRLPVQR